MFSIIAVAVTQQFDCLIYFKSYVLMLIGYVNLHRVITATTITITTIIQVCVVAASFFLLPLIIILEDQDLTKIQTLI